VRRGYAGRAAAQWNTCNDKLNYRLGFVNRQLVTDTHIVSGFDSLAINSNVASFNFLHSQAAGFEEPSAP